MNRRIRAYMSHDGTGYYGYMQTLVNGHYVDETPWHYLTH